MKMVPVLPSKNIERDLHWYKKYTGFLKVTGDLTYAVLKKNDLEIHLQWHADTKEDPLLGGSVIKIFVEEIESHFRDFLDRKTVIKQSLKYDTLWGTHEFGFYDLNKNAIFYVQNV